MGNSRMHYFDKVEYDLLDLMLTLRPGKFRSLWALIMQYAHATEAGDLDVQIPVTGDLAIDGYLRVVCADVRDKTQAYFQRVQTNTDNANKRYNKSDKGKEAQPAAAPPPKAKGKAQEVKQEKPDNAPVTLEDFVKLGGDGPESKLMEKLYHDLVAANWIYHGFDLREYYTKCTDHYNSVGKKWRCGLMAVIAYNAHRRFLSDKPRFDAICDLAIEENWGDGLCAVCELMNKTQSYSIGGVRYEGHEYDSIEKFIEFLKKF